MRGAGWLASSSGWPSAPMRSTSACSDWRRVTTGDRQARERLAEAARAAERGRFGQQMREIADGVRRGDAKATQGEQQRAVARELDRLADKVGGTQSSGADREGQQLADDLSKARELRDRLADLQRQIEAAGKQGEPGERASGRVGQAGPRRASTAGGKPGRVRGAGRAGQAGRARDSGVSPTCSASIWSSCATRASSASGSSRPRRAPAER